MVYQSAVAEVSEQADIKVCMNEAHQQLVGIRAAQQQLDRAFLDFAHAQSNLQGGVAAAQLAYDDGRRALATARGASCARPRSTRGSTRASTRSSRRCPRRA